MELIYWYQESNILIQLPKEAGITVQHRSWLQKERRCMWQHQRPKMLWQPLHCMIMEEQRKEKNLHWILNIRRVHISMSVWYRIWIRQSMHRQQVRRAIRLMPAIRSRRRLVQPMTFFMRRRLRNLIPQRAPARSSAHWLQNPDMDRTWACVFPKLQIQMHPLRCIRTMKSRLNDPSI